MQFVLTKIDQNRKKWGQLDKCLACLNKTCWEFSDLRILIVQA